MTRLSNRQYPMLRIFAEERKTFRMSIETAKQFDQRPFRSMLWQKWIDYRPDEGFFITDKGRDAWHEFLETDITRKNPLGDLTSYFDPQAYARRARREAAKGSGRAMGLGANA